MTQITLNDYTPEIKNKIQKYKDNAVKDLYNGEEYKKYNPKNTEKYIDYIYTLANKELPVVVIANNPLEYRIKFHELFNSNKFNKLINLQFEIKNNTGKYSKSEIDFLLPKIKKEIEEFDNSQIDIKKAVNTHYLFACSEYSRIYLMWYKFIKDEFNLKTKKETELDWLYENINAANIAKCYFNKKVVLVLRMPEKIKKVGDFIHDISNEGAIIYSNYKSYYLNGRKVENWVFEKYHSKTLTFEDFTNCNNEETKSAIITLIKEHEGNEGLLKFLNAELIDTKTFTHSDGYVDTHKLYKSKEIFSFAKDSKGKTGVKLAWHEEKCASTGQTYLIETCPTFNDAESSAKFLRPSKVPFNLPYLWQSCN